MLEWYKKFCCGVFYLLKEKAKSDIPFFATFMFTLFLFILIVHGVDSIVYLFLKIKNIQNKYITYVLVFIFAIPNYLLVFKDKKFLHFYDKKLSYLKTVLAILLIFSICLGLVLIAGPSCAECSD